LRLQVSNITLLKEISLKLSEPWISEWFMALHPSNSQLIP